MKINPWLRTSILLITLDMYAAGLEKQDNKPWATSIFLGLPIELQYKISAYVLGDTIKQNIFKPTLLHTLQQSKNRALIHSVAFNHKNHQLAVAQRHIINIWDINTAQIVRVLQDRKIDAFGFEMSGGTSVAFNYDGSRIACINNRSILRIYNMTTNQEIYPSNDYNDRISSFAFNPNKTEILCGDSDGTFHIHNTDTLEKIHTFKGHRNNIKSIVFNEKGSLIVTASTDKTARIFDATTYQEIAILPHKDIVLSAAFHPHEDWIISACMDHYAYLWNILTKKIIHTCKHDSWVCLVAFSPNESLMACCDYNKTIQIWDTTIGKQLHIEQPL